jgi:hypothetical protein
MAEQEFQIDIRKAFKNLQTDSGNRIAELLGDVAVKNTVIEELMSETTQLRSRLAELESAMELATASKEGHPAIDRDRDRDRDRSRPRPQVVKMPADPNTEDVEVVGLDA